ncbi:MAG: ATPase domain-containing protein [Pseudomonadota bacterium]
MPDKVQLKLLATGVPGLDAILGGGLPELSFTIIGGSPGSGKTTFAQQIMFSLATPDRPALFFTALGEPPLKMLRYQQNFSFFDFDKVDRSIKFVNLGPHLVDGDFDKILAAIVKEVQIQTPRYIFIDSFRSVIQPALNDAHGLPNLQRFTQQLAIFTTSWQATTFLIGEYLPEETNKNPIFTIADCILWFTQNVWRNSMVRKIQVVKVRGLAQTPGLHTFRINPDGVEVFPRVLPAPEPPEHDASTTPAPVTEHRLGTGILALDNMLGGGLPIGFSMLLVGPSGSGKSRIATEFLTEGARQGEPGVIATFEKRPGEMHTLYLDTSIRTGKLAVLTMQSLDLSTDETLHDLTTMIDQTKAKRVVFDSLSGFELALAPEFREDFRESLYRMIKVLTHKGVTLLMTTELEDRFTEFRFSPYGGAFLADAIVIQRYVEIGGQLKTVIAVVKLRGSQHSRDFRLFEITTDGIAIGAEPFQYEGLLTGLPARAGLDVD